MFPNLNELDIELDMSHPVIFIKIRHSSITRLALSFVEDTYPLEIFCPNFKTFNRSLPSWPPGTDRTGQLLLRRREPSPFVH